MSIQTILSDITGAERVALVVIAELYAQGVRHFVFSPGSRSSPLVVACDVIKAATDGISTYVHLDERAAAYFALGVAKGATDQQGVAIITTSGTAVANLLPAACEASESGIPIILLTADRPRTVVGTRANQTIPQEGIFGKFTRYNTSIHPYREITTEDYLQLRRIVATAYYYAHKPLPGPAHLNCEFEEPLVSANLSTTITQEFLKPQTVCLTTQAGEAVILDGLPAIDSAQTLIVCGECSSQIANDVCRAATQWEIPVIADVLSPLRQSRSCNQSLIVYYGELILSLFGNQIDPAAIIIIGDYPIGRSTVTWLREMAKKSMIASWSDNYRTVDPDSIVNYRITAPLHHLVQAFTNKRHRSNLASKLKALDDRVDRLIREIFIPNSKPISELAAARIALQSMPPESICYVGNSLPIRHINRVGGPYPEGVILYGHRGVSGIDGTIAQALGVAAQKKRPLRLLLGDLAFLYDLNSLLIFDQLQNSVQIIVINNNGGGIFEAVSHLNQLPTFNRFFLTPHNRCLGRIGEAFGLPAFSCETSADFVTTLNELGTKSALIEVICHKTSAAKDLEELLRHLKESLP